MTTRIGINGFGRVGRLTYRAIRQYHNSNLEVVAINDLADPVTNAHLLKWDSNFGQYPGTVEAGDNSMVIDGKEMRVLSEGDPAKITWQDYGVDIVIESTGLFTDAVRAAAHLGSSVKKVIISAPSKNTDLTVVLGVNENRYSSDKHNVISNASCTTNCIAPVVKVLNDSFGIEKGLMTTIHSYTNDQKILDVVHKDLRRARAAAMNIIPTSTGAAKAVTVVIPELEGKLHGMAFRVPTSTVSVVDFVAELTRKVTVEQVNAALKEASSNKLSNIMAYCEEPLVSIDFKGNSHSAIVDGPSTMVIGDTMVKVLAWYDNEWGYSSRLADLTEFVASKM